MTQKEMTQKIAELEAQKNEVSGQKCEVYSRVVGYLRPISLWNDGKKEEFKVRKNYSPCK
jgi:anaerobic ribonucleoside-triphosphate reductase